MQEMGEVHPISRAEFCRRLNEMDISSNVRTLRLDIEVMQENGFEIMSYLKDKEKFTMFQSTSSQCQNKDTD